MDVHVTKRRPLKGAVLFTVLVVMVVMLILMITTIGLASNASRRAYSEYNDRQTNSTARSVVESAIDHLKTNSALGSSIVTNCKSGPVDVQVTANGSNDLGDGLGRVDRLFFTYVGSDDESGFYVTGSGKDIIKVTAVVTQGGVTSTYSQYCIGNTGNNDDATSGGGLVALGGFEGYAEPGVDAHSPAYFGVSDSFSYDELVNLSNPNDGAAMNALIVNSSATTKTQMRVMLGKKEGFTVMGNLSNNVGALHVYNENYSDTDYKNGLSGSSKPTDNAYIYVGGCFDIMQKLYIGKGYTDGWDEADKNQAPINLYCGRLNMGNSGTSSKICGNIDIYCYNEGTDSAMWTNTDAEAYAKNPWSSLGGSDQSMLISWAEKLSDTSHMNSLVDSGSFYTMGNLRLQERVEIAGDLYVKGDLLVENLVVGNSKIKGNVYVGGSITGANAGDITTICEKNVYNGTTDDPDNPKRKAFSISSLPAKVNSFLNGDLKLANLRKDTVVTSDKVYKEFYEDVTDPESGTVTKHIKGAVNKSKLIVDGTTVIYKQVGNDIVAEDLDGNTVAVSSGNITGTSIHYDAVIGGNCILAGKFDGKTLYINPSSTVWIDCFNVELVNNCNIIINDRNGKVNFYFPTDKTEDSKNVDSSDASYKTKYQALFSTYNFTHTGGYNDPVDYHWISFSHPYTYNNYFITSGDTTIRTVEYVKKFGSGVDIVRYPTADSDDANDWLLPQVGFYAREGGRVMVRFNNPIFFTGDIFMPDGDFYAVSGCYPENGLNIKYNGSKVETERAGFIGSIIVGNIREFNNKITMLYVDDPPGGGEHIDGDTIYEWVPMNGYADY